ncbi:hypothetical protein FisN_25Lh099 [Fistulifera solaris]|uniref:Inward rectifier potassium channel C-terminal domain-containing protein n=1 Tax=Fistulifera solaris TaxID=1519565 RepID=A0A1Z5J7V1_FISSO|nr:hypothetical protein FisN_25Lh099 [Fistulifera solaris]|eukprot:GAX10050.1 hypothetical protein FisN_25Lh099 [Fistulifera solaris]
MNPNQTLAIYLHWMFRVNFLFLFGLMWLAFVGLTIVFAGFIAIAGRMDSSCVQVSRNDFGAAGTPFSDAFALSWTTFTTVGYGTTNTALSHNHSNMFKCFWVDFVCSVEALLGIIYSGFCGAILFGKILRVQSSAQVIFSDPLLIRYGAGLTTEFEAMAGESTDNDKSPCPMLEFRIVNKLYGDIGGEIMDATLNVVASVGKDHLNPMSQRFSRKNLTSNNGHYDSNHSYNSSDMDVDPPIQQADSAEIGDTFSNIDAETNITDKHIFSKMHVEPSDHPFFKRVWLVKHVLNQDSPILKPRIRRMIRRNGGHWPQKLNSYASIRDSLQFNQILVSFNGVSNASSIDVYAQRIYDFYDLNIGYQFVNILYRSENGAVGVDIDLINDVREQNGGGGEPLLE